MFSRFARLPLRRCIHTAPQHKRAPFSFGKTTRTVLAGSALATAFVGYQISRKANQVALDAPPAVEPHMKTHLAHSTPTSSRPKDTSPTPSSSSTSTSSSERDAFIPDDPSSAPPDSAASSLDSKTTSETTSEEGASTEGEGEGKPAQSGAFNPETGEINWDCPCLGGMAHGPCGPEFREAFSCFVFSEAEPKGINCVDKFQNMQNCFRAHPEVYADEIMDDEEEEAPPASDPSDVPPDSAQDEKANGVASSDTKTTQKSHPEESQPIAASS